MPIQPRLIRLRDAPAYLGMNRNHFNKAVRPALTEIRIGKQGVAFDRLELDAWVEQYKSCNGRPARNRGDEVWDAIEAPGCGSGVGSGISTSRSSATAFTKALERVNSKRRN
jgi:predicted DNA-binding transcriptional regulator AlpA